MLFSGFQTIDLAADSRLVLVSVVMSAVGDMAAGRQAEQQNQQETAFQQASRSVAPGSILCLFGGCRSVRLVNLSTSHPVSHFKHRFDWKLCRHWFPFLRSQGRHVLAVSAILNTWLGWIRGRSGNDRSGVGFKIGDGVDNVIPNPYCRGWEGGVFMSSEVIFTAIVGIVLLGDPVSWRFWTGAALVLGAVVALNRLKVEKQRRKSIPTGNRSLINRER